MAIVTMKSLLESGVHFGHQVKRWNPKMKKFIYAARHDIHIIDLQKTVVCIKEAFEVVRKTVLKKQNILFVGTKKQAQQIIADAAEKCGMYYINHHWMGGILTNFDTIRKTIVRLKQLEKMQVDGTFEGRTKKEVSLIKKETVRLTRKFGGIKNMSDLPGLIFVIDVRVEAIAVAEATKLGIPIVAVVDTNSDPTGITYPIPGNDDAIRALSLYADIISQAVMEADKEVGLEIITTEADFKEQIENKDMPIQDKDSESESEEVFSFYGTEDYSNYEAKAEDKEISEVQSYEEEVARKSGIGEEKLYGE